MFRVCDTPYTCVDDGHQPMWVANDPTNDSAGGKTKSNSCKIDSLIAVGKALECDTSYMSVPGQCTAHHGPILLDKKDGSSNVVFIPSETRGHGNGSVPTPPTHIEADLRCSSSILSEDTFEVDSKVPAVRYSSLMRVDLVPNERKEKESTSPSVPSSPLPPPVVVTPSTSVPSPASTSVPSLPESLFGEGGGKDFLWGDSEHLLSAQELPSVAGWRACKWGPGERASCRADADCPLSTDAAFHAWFEGTAEKTPSAKVSIDTLITVANEEGTTSARVPMPVDVKDVDGTVVGSFASKSRADLESLLKAHYDSDSGFRNGVRTMVEMDRTTYGKYADARRENACRSDGKCASIDPPPRHTFLFDGSAQRDFLLKNGKEVEMVSGGTSLRVQAVDCGKAKCDANSGDVVVDVASVDGKVTLTPQTERADAYRMRFGDKEFLVANTVSVPAHSGACADALCAAYSHACPPSHCRKEGDGKCVSRM